MPTTAAPYTATLRLRTQRYDAGVRDGGSCALAATFLEDEYYLCAVITWDHEVPCPRGNLSGPGDRDAAGASSRGNATNASDDEAAHVSQTHVLDDWFPQCETHTGVPRRARARIEAFGSYS